MARPARSSTEIKGSIGVGLVAIVRIDKYISDTGIASRKEAKELIRNGRISLNGVPARSPDEKVDHGRDVLCLDGRVIEYTQLRYFMLNKPEGYISATEDGRLPTVVELFPKQLQNQGIFPVGRLDRDTTGLILITNDGDFAHNVISPKKRVPKRYEAWLDLPVTDCDVAAFKAGIALAGGEQCLPARLSAAGGDLKHALVMVYEGKYHQVKRMFASRGKTVIRLHRRSIGALELDEALLPGQWRELTGEEIMQSLAKAPEIM